MRSEYVGAILDVRAVEDCIRATRQYTKGAFRRKVEHPVQGADFPSKAITEYYEVYPELELNWDMSASDAWAWVWGDVAHIDVWFHYNYLLNRARIEVGGGCEAVKALAIGILGFSEALAKVVVNGKPKQPTRTTSPV